MHHYPFHIGDYRSGTIHLTQLERWVYRDLLDICYDTEGPLPLDQPTLFRLAGARTEDHKAAVLVVLEDKFVRTDEGYTNDRVQSEIDLYRKKADSARRANQKRWGSDGDLKSDPVQTNVGAKSDATVGDEDAAARKLPPCPTSKIIDLYHKQLPELPEVRLVSERRKRAIAGLWRWVLTSKRTDNTPRAENAEQALDWIDAYFERVKRNDFLMGRSGRTGAHANWMCDIDYLLTERGRIQVIEKT